MEFFVMIIIYVASHKLSNYEFIMIIFVKMSIIIWTNKLITGDWKLLVVNTSMNVWINWKFQMSNGSNFVVFTLI